MSRIGVVAEPERDVRAALLSQSKNAVPVGDQKIVRVVETGKTASYVLVAKQVVLLSPGQTG